ncbi:MAG: hypothetical protein PF570_06145 [Candidatus Cloacimonetes bacterium]|jgi:hypothetical protein|nr:hypothetical protein [Candidatus Cloacimonadota bacterium]
MIFQFIIIQINYITLVLLSFVILSVRQLPDVSKDGGFIEENLRRITSHFDKACPELDEGLSVTKKTVGGDK